LECKIRYYYRLFGVNYGGVQQTQAAPLTVSATTAACAAPPLPANFGAGPSSIDRIRLTWSDVDGEASYDVERWSGSSWTVIGSAPRDASQYYDGSLTAGAQFSYRIRARNSYGTSAYTASASGSTYRYGLFLPLGE
jgi:titin